MALTIKWVSTIEHRDSRQICKIYSSMLRPNCVYLDRLIPRKSFLYNSSQKMGDIKDIDYHRLTLIRMSAGAREEDSQSLSMQSILRRQLFKPDFQRATQAWTPEQCVELLESVLKYQVVPSVILWRSPDGSIFVLDGGHRISVLLAYIEDDWGDKDTRHLTDYREIERNRRLGQVTRQMIRDRGMASFEDHGKAINLYQRYFRENQGNESKTKLDMGDRAYDLAQNVKKWQTSDPGFPIQWVEGDYKVAEDSFLRINRGGTSLLPWEIQLVENRRSSFARLVMSIANVSEAERCWPKEAEENKALSASQIEQAESIVERARSVADLLFHPRESEGGQIYRPLMVIPPRQPEKAPSYTAEVLTIVKGRQGQQVDLIDLMGADKNADVGTILTNASNLVKDAYDALTHFKTESSRSLGIVSAFYFYNDTGVPVRSLFYGFLFWVNYGSTEEIIERKRLFSAYRGAFEHSFRAEKQNVITRISRKSGSGAEVTLQTARYYDGLLQLLIKYAGNTSQTQFRSEHKTLIRKISNAVSGPSTSKKGKSTIQELTSEEDTTDATRVTVSAGRSAVGSQKRRLQLSKSFEHGVRCEICHGLLDLHNPDVPIQYDHIEKHSEGGLTQDENLRPTHPFCNLHRDRIEEIRSSTNTPSLPRFALGVGSPEATPIFVQMSFSFGWDENDQIEDYVEDKTVAVVVPPTEV